MKPDPAPRARRPLRRLLSLLPLRLAACGLGAALLAATPTWAGAAAAAPAKPELDLATRAGFQRTCAALPAGAQALRSDDERLAWVVCRDVDLVRDLATWATRGMAQMDKARPSDEQLLAEVVRKLDEVREQLRRSRLQLEKVQLAERHSLLLVPGQWQLDLNGNGQQEPWETWFFALPRPHAGPARLHALHDDTDRYQAEFDAQAQVRVDQSDVLWALSYHQFLEGLLTGVRAFDLDLKRRELVLGRPALLQRAHGLIASGLATSGQLRRSVLRETDDEDEWVAHPGQRHSVFPIPTTAADFDTWRQLLQELSAVWQGQHLLPTARGAGGLIGELAPVCAQGQGLDVARLFQAPPPAGTRVGERNAARLASAYCRPVDAAHPLGGLGRRIDGVASGAGGMSALRYLYWIN